eukprot:XP_006255270.1 PREDICTED: uncharacterized protein LOC102548978 [Rattus norvegicus]
MESRGQDLQMSSFSCEGPTRVPCLELFSGLRWHEGVLFYCHQGLSAVLTLTKSREDKRPQDLPGEPSKHTRESPEQINTHSLTGPGRSPGTNSKPTADQTRMLELTDTFWKHSAPEGVECRLWCQSPAISGLLLMLEHIDSARQDGWSHKPQRVLLSLPPWCWDYRIYCLAFTWPVGIGLRSSHLHNKHFTNTTISPSTW